MKPITHYTILYMILHPEEFSRVTRFIRSVIEIGLVVLYLNLSKGFPMSEILQVLLGLLFLYVVGKSNKTC